MLTSLVTGGAGFIGSHLVESLLADGRRVVVLDDLSTGDGANLDAVRDHPQLRIVLDSIANEARLAELLDEADEVYHLAAVVGVRLVLEDPDRTVATNVGPTEVLLHRLSARPKPLFLASTSEVYGKTSKMPLAEDDDLVLGPTTRGRWIYACSKALDEYLALAHHRRSGLPVVIGRFFNVVGPRQIGRYGMVLPRFVDQALAGGPLVVHDDGRQVRCFAHVRDVVGAVRRLMACPEAAGRVFNLGSDVPVTIRGLAEAVVRLINPALEIEHVPYEQAFEPGFEDIRCRVPDLTRVREAIGYRPGHSLDDIVREVLAWKQRGTDGLF
ncbi:MAG TPA: NAD-dependent epimerase/dehydratase family protein [Gemmataceae bacterium]|jgi:UDP-glucose 4-epimerase|nr:NAD-dependent epimerase/dehydratase family protein [Gemmataceae bacterium]